MSNRTALNNLRLPPHSIQSEQSLLGGLLINNSAWHEVRAIVTAEDFYRRDHRLLFTAVGALIDANKACDVITLSEYLDANNQLLEVGGHDYIAAVTENTPSAANVLSYAERVRELSICRQLIDRGYTLAEQAYDQKGRNSDEILAEHQAALDRIAIRKYGRHTDWQSVMRDGVQLMTEIEDARNASGNLGVAMGIRKLDNCFPGLYGPRLIVVAGRPALGKTALTMQITNNAAKAGHRIGICSLEMGTDELALRSISYRCSIDFGAMMRGDNNAITAAADRMADLHGLGIWIDDDTYALSGIVSRITQWKREHGIELAVVDHIGLIEADGYTSRNDQLGHISRTLKKLAKKLDMPIILVSQLNRTVEREKRRPKLSDLRDSGNIEQDADIVLMIHSEDEDEGDVIDIEFGLLKNRCGRKGWIKGYQFRGAYQRFEESSNVYYGVPGRAVR